MDYEFVAAMVIGGFVLGAVVGALVTHNNYKHFKTTERAIKDVILFNGYTANQKILHVRNKLGI